MSIDENKRIVAAFCAHFEHAAIGEVLGLMREDATWWVNGKAHLFPGAGLKTRSEMAQIWHRLYAVLDGGLTMEVLDMIAQDDRAVAMLRSHAITRNGRAYENDYLMLFRLSNGKVVEVREYTDPMHAIEVFE